MSPSYKALLKRRRYLYENQEQVRNPALRKEFATLARLKDKVAAYEWLRERGHATVSHQVHSSIKDALRRTKLETFVLKPASGHSLRGVYLLSRDGEGGYACAMTGHHFASATDLVEHYQRLQKRSGVKLSKNIIVEEYLEDSLGFDVPLAYKVYAFAAGAPIVMQRYAASYRPPEELGFEFYDEVGQRLGPIREKAPPGDRWNLRPPGDLPDMFRVARDIVVQAGVSFVRIDLFSTPNGVVVGGFTTVPNTSREIFSDEYDTKMGDLWTRSLESLGLDYFGYSWKRAGGLESAGAQDVVSNKGALRHLLKRAGIESGFRRLWGRTEND